MVISSGSARRRPPSGSGTTSTSRQSSTLRTATTARPSPPSGTGVYGSVTAGPTCPVERVDQPCPPRPVSSAEVDARQGDRTITKSTTDDQGRFAIGLRPGNYTLVVVASGMHPRCEPANVTVPAGAPVRADIGAATPASAERRLRLNPADVVNRGCRRRRRCRRRRCRRRTPPASSPCRRAWRPCPRWAC